uniref:liprin-beta-1-like isoform X3 n=1 Tax=Myxine glutinosa TaxID=7769 RepID=UPI00358E670B
MSDASEMLAAALEQMDGIIAGSKAMEFGGGFFDCQSPVSPFGGVGSVEAIGGLRVLQLADELRISLELSGSAEERETLRERLPEATHEALVSWLRNGLSNGHFQYGGESQQDQLNHLEGEKESLILQVSVLNDQVEAQEEKIRDLEGTLEEQQGKVVKTEGLLQQEMLNRTTLESQRLEMMTEFSNLKMKLAELEKGGRCTQDNDDERLLDELAETRCRATTLETEKSHLENKIKNTKSLTAKLASAKLKVSRIQCEKQCWERACIQTKAEAIEMQEKLVQREMEIERLKDELVNNMSDQAETVEREEVMKRKLREKYQEILQLKEAMESLMAENEDKDRKIEELRQSLTRYRKVQEMVILAQGRGATEKSLMSASDNSSPDQLLSIFVPEGMSMQNQESPVMIPECSLDREHCTLEMELQGESLMINQVHVEEQPEHRCEDVRWKPSRTDVWQQQQSLIVHDEKDAMPQDNAIQEEARISPTFGKTQFDNHTTEEFGLGAGKSRASFGRGFFKVKASKRTASAPNLEMDGSSPSPSPTEQSPSPLSSPGAAFQEGTISPQTKKKARGIRKIFGILKRSHSTNLNPGDEPQELSRGGMRSTSGPRLGWSRDLQGASGELDAPFAKWSTEQVCSWLHEQGLGLYTPMARQWVSSGQTLLHATAHDLDKELGIKNALHKKKLQLALQAMGSEEEDGKGNLDHNWVTRWLDDVGLSQYKDQFNEARIDGRMLHYITVDDLLSLKVTSTLHHLSFKRAIQVLRMNSFHPNCLRRRPSDEVVVTPSEVTQWTNHRVMEWLRSADLAEYAPNLRGSGVHGGLMVLEPRFSIESMALLLNITPSKTLLRRHLATHFALLVGPHAQRQKLEVLESPGYIQLTPSTKIKPKKLPLGISGFGSLRRRRQEEPDDYVCPMELGQPGGLAAQPGFGGPGPRRVATTAQGYGQEDDLDRLEQMEDSEGTVRQIGAFSEGINNLTNMLSEDGSEFGDSASKSPRLAIGDD